MPIKTFRKQRCRKQTKIAAQVEGNSIFELRKVISLLLHVPVRNVIKVSCDWLCKSKWSPDWLLSPLPGCHSALVPPPSHLQLELRRFVVEQRDGSGTRCSRTLSAVRYCN